MVKNYYDRLQTLRDFLNLESDWDAALEVLHNYNNYEPEFVEFCDRFVSNNEGDLNSFAD